MKGPERIERYGDHMLQQATRPHLVAERTLAVCRHHWMIEAPSGPVSRGVCRVCDEVREFKNYIDGTEANPTQTSARYEVAPYSKDTDSGDWI